MQKHQRVKLLSILLQEPAADLLRKHGGKTGEELKAEGNENTLSQL